MMQDLYCVKKSEYSSSFNLVVFTGDTSSEFTGSKSLWVMGALNIHVATVICI